MFPSRLSAPARVLAPRASLAARVCDPFKRVPKRTGRDGEGTEDTALPVETQTRADTFFNRHPTPHDIPKPTRRPGPSSSAPPEVSTDFAEGMVGKQVQWR